MLFRSDAIQKEIYGSKQVTDITPTGRFGHIKEYVKEYTFSSLDFVKDNIHIMIEVIIHTEEILNN